MEIMSIVGLPCAWPPVSLSIIPDTSSYLRVGHHSEEILKYLRHFIHPNGNINLLLQSTLINMRNPLVPLGSLSSSTENYQIVNLLVRWRSLLKKPQRWS
jgi:hypothetical protein